MTTQTELTTDITVYTVETCEVENENLAEGDELIKEGTHTDPIDEYYYENDDMKHLHATVTRHETIPGTTFKN